ncbi:MAG TPA: hypothetical protein VEU51_15215 [Candidatus Acidoferrales bacterium]|nr:hypothetical protein [Candidatus Acidoferrales bacterium]
MTFSSKSFFHLLICAALASVAWLGCGVKSMPIPPEAARPEKISDLEAATAKNGIRLTWGRPDTYAGGDKMRDLAGFTVSRSEADGPYHKIGDIPVTDQQRFQVQRTFTYVDKATELGKTYRYEVLSNTSDGYTSEPSNTVTVVRQIPPPPPRPEDFMLPTPTPLP